ncbi:MAG: hypothetical protein IK095_02340 [Oscillospiraceae bacterium]|nr:hypothetical protein [Oscillospiraceae bacterium]
MTRELFRNCLRVLGGLVLLAATAFVLVRYGKTVDWVPTDFAPNGLPEAFGPKEKVFVPLGLGWLIFGLVTVLGFRPKLWKVPRRTPRAMQAFGDIHPVLGLVLALYFSWVAVCTVLGRGLGAWCLPVLAAALALPLLYALVQSLRGASGKKGW